MVDRIQLLRNVGRFDSVDAGANLPLAKLALIYAENARGKTTLSTILRSLSTGEAGLINDRQRLGSHNAPHVVVAAGTDTFTFQNGAWSGNWPRVAVFDDAFVAQNVCSGMEIEPDHRQNLHELILGAEGVALNSSLQTYVERIEEHNRVLRDKGDAIPATARGNFTVEAFCALEENPRITELIQETERNLAAARAAEKVRQTNVFTPISLPRFDEAALNVLLQRDLPDLDAKAATHVQAHINNMGERGEAWVAEGISMIAPAAEEEHAPCPFCTQDLQDSPIIQHYRAYFSTAYSDFKQALLNEKNAIISTHGGDVPGAFERAISLAVQLREFWQAFIEMPEVTVDTAAIARAWKVATENVLDTLNIKQGAPLDPLTLSQRAIDAIAAYHACCDEMETLSERLQAVNSQIALVKERAASADVAVLASDLVRLKAIEVRYSSELSPLCQEYLDEKAAKAATERLRDEARAALNEYREIVFPTYENAINVYLQRFNAGFRISSVTSVNTRSGSSCTYNVVINNIPVAVTAANGAAFRNTLSAGDRNTLALAFFFVSLDQDAELLQKTVVIDDPMTSLDEHRSLATVQEIRRLFDRVNQIIVFSHSKQLLCALWEGADRAARSAMRITRDGNGSNLTPWDVNRECITEHDYRYGLIAEYIQRSDPAQERNVAAALRSNLEAFMRVAYPQNFPPGTLLGPFIEVCRRRHGAANEILSPADTSELRDLLDYANRFHHDTNAAWETETINDQELLDRCRRVLNFTRRS